MRGNHFLRNLALVGFGVVGLAILVPTPDQASMQARPSSVAASPKLLTYLEAQLRPGSAHVVVHTKALATTDTLRGSQVLAHGSISIAAPTENGSVVEEFPSHSTTALNVRAGPDKDAKKLFVLPAGAAVRINQASGDWAQILTADGKIGWVYESYIAQAKPQRGADGSAPRIAIVGPQAPEQSVTGPEFAEKPQLDREDVESTLAVNVADKPHSKAKAFLLANDAVMRSSPSKGSSKISTIQGGSKLVVAEWDRSWARVILSDGTSGWINAR